MSLNAVSSSETTSRLQDLPPPGEATQSYTAQRGDTLSEIAKAHGVSLDGLLAANPQVLNPDVIYPDQAIALPAGVKSLGGEGAPVSATTTRDIRLQTRVPSSLGITQFHPVESCQLFLPKRFELDEGQRTGDPCEAYFAKYEKKESGRVPLTRILHVARQIYLLHLKFEEWSPQCP